MIGIAFILPFAGWCQRTSHLSERAAKSGTFGNFWRTRLAGGSVSAGIHGIDEARADQSRWLRIRD
jgi:hypothetical protein